MYPYSGSQPGTRSWGGILLPAPGDHKARHKVCVCTPVAQISPLLVFLVFGVLLPDHLSNHRQIHQILVHLQCSLFYWSDLMNLELLSARSASVFLFFPLLFFAGSGAVFQDLRSPLRSSSQLNHLVALVTVPWSLRDPPTMSWRLTPVYVWMRVSVLVCGCHSQQASVRVHGGWGGGARTPAENRESHLNAECRDSLVIRVWIGAWDWRQLNWKNPEYTRSHKRCVCVMGGVKGCEAAVPEFTYRAPSCLFF